MNLDFSCVASAATTCVSAGVQQFWGQSVADNCADIGQFGPMLSIAMAMGQPGAQAAVAPKAHGRVARAGRITRALITSNAANLRSGFICCIENTAELSGNLCAGSHARQVELRKRGWRRVRKRGLTEVGSAGEDYFPAVSAETGRSMSSLRMTRLVALILASSKPWPWVIASVGQASTQ